MWLMVFAMSPVREKYEAMMQGIDTLLAAEGFRRSGQCFRKNLPEGGVRWSICAQKSRHSTRDFISFTFNVRAERKQRPAWYEDYVPHTTWYGGAGGRIGELMPEENDTWWDIDESTSVSSLSAQINGILSSYVLPFLKKFETEQQLDAYHRQLSDSREWRRNYPVAIDALAYDLVDKKDNAEIEKRINTVRHVGSINGVDKTVVEATIERVLKTYGPDKLPLQKHPASRSGFPGFERLFERLVSKFCLGIIGALRKIAVFFAPK